MVRRAVKESYSNPINPSRLDGNLSSHPPLTRYRHGELY